MDGAQLGGPGVEAVDGGELCSVTTGLHESVGRLYTGKSTRDGVTGDVAVPQVFRKNFPAQHRGGANQRLERCRMRVVSSLT
jgi:hypothetical protein